MKLRKAEGSDLYPLAHLWAQSFPGARTAEDRAAQLEAGIPYGGLNTAWVLEDRGRLAGAFRAYPMRQILAGAVVPVLGLSGVATAPTARRRGVARRICEEALRIGRERGDLVSILYPFRPSYYRALGWGVAGEMQSYRFSPDSLPAYDQARSVRAAEKEDLGQIMASYARAARGANGLIERDSGVWAQHFSRSGVYPFIYEANGVSGYLLARFGAGPSPGAGVLIVKELVAEDDDAYLGLLGWLALQRDQVREVRYDARPDEHFESRLSDPRPPGFQPARRHWYPSARRIRGPMLRIIDLPALFEGRTRWGDEAMEGFAFRLEVEDQELPENSGPWILTGEAGRVRVERDLSRSGCPNILRTDMATLAEIYTGSITPSAAIRVGLAEGAGSIRALDRLFETEHDFWLLDEF